jgi:hypothetical protein
MAGLNDLIRSSGGGSIAKPLLLGLGALLATNVLFGAKDRPPAQARNRQRTRVIPVECWADWADW